VERTGGTWLAWLVLCSPVTAHVLRACAREWKGGAAMGHSVRPFNAPGEPTATEEEFTE